MQGNSPAAPCNAERTPQTTTKAEFRPPQRRCTVSLPASLSKNRSLPLTIEPSRGGEEGCTCACPEHILCAREQVVCGHGGRVAAGMDGAPGCLALRPHLHLPQTPLWQLRAHAIQLLIFPFQRADRPRGTNTPGRLNPSPMYAGRQADTCINAFLEAHRRRLEPIHSLNTCRTCRDCPMMRQPVAGHHRDGSSK
jgi:hypothetical protein